MPSLQKLLALKTNSEAEARRKRSLILHHVGFWDLNATAQNDILKKFRHNPFYMRETHFANFIMLVKHVKNNQFKFYKDTEKVKNEYR